MVKDQNHRFEKKMITKSHCESTSLSLTRMEDTKMFQEDFQHNQVVLIFFPVIFI